MKELKPGCDEDHLIAKQKAQLGLNENQLVYLLYQEENSLKEHDDPSWILVQPMALSFGEAHPGLDEPQWILTVWDLEKATTRLMACSNILAWRKRGASGDGSG